MKQRSPQAEMPSSADADRAMAALPPPDLQVLASIRQGLHSAVAPEVTSDMGRTICEFAIEFLDKLIIKHTVWPAIFRRKIQQEAATLMKGAEFLAKTNNIDRQVHSAAVEAANHAAALQNGSLTELEQTDREVNASLETIMSALITRHQTARRGAALELTNELLRDLAANLNAVEDDFNQACKQRSEKYRDKAGKHAAVTVKALEEYLKVRFPERKDIQVTSFNELVGGSSKSTILIDVNGLEGDRVSSLVVRLDRHAGSTNTRVLDEVDTLSAVFRGGLPVPELLWVEPDACKLGFAFIVVRKIDAVLGGGMWNADPQLCSAETAMDLASVLARLHAMDAKKLQLTGALKLSASPTEHPMKGLIRNIRELWGQKKLEPDGVLESCLSWLETNMPPAPKKSSLVHGDVSFHNLLVRDKKIAALLDWELSHLGDPIEDLSYARLCVEQLIPWDDFLAEYQSQGGGEFAENTGTYYRIWRDVRNAVYTLACSHSFHSERNLDLRWGFFATYYRMVILGAARRIAETATPSVVSMSR